MTLGSSLSVVDEDPNALPRIKAHVEKQNSTK